MLCLYVLLIIVLLFSTLDVIANEFEEEGLFADQDQDQGEFGDQGKPPKNHIMF